MILTFVAMLLIFSFESLTHLKDAAKSMKLDHEVLEAVQKLLNLTLELNAVDDA